MFLYCEEQELKGKEPYILNAQSYPIDAKVLINSLAYNSDKSLYYFEMSNCNRVLLGNVIKELTLHTKLKLKAHKVNKSKGKYNG
jgi:cell fate regulator YaaT (PSP1 superfamily)